MEVLLERKIQYLRVKPTTTHLAYSSMITAMLPKSNRYRFGVRPLPNLYVMWFEHSRAATMMRIWAGTRENEMVYHVSRTVRSSLR